MDSLDISRQFQFRLETIVVSNFRIGYPLVEVIESHLGLEYGYNFTFTFEQDLANCLIHFRYILNVHEEDITKRKVLVHCDINFIYKVIDLRSFVEEKDDAYIMDTGLIGQLLNIAFGTSRGIIYERTRGYSVNTFILPASTLDTIMKHNIFPKETNPSANAVVQPS